MIVSQSRLAVAGDDGHTFAVARVAADIAGDGASGRAGQAPAHGQVAAVDIAGGEGGGEGGVDRLGLGDDHQAGRVFVQAMDDAGAGLAADAGEGGAAMGDEGVDEGAVRVAGGGMDDETGRLVEDQQMAVFVEDGEGDCLSGRYGGGDGGEGDGILRAGADFFRNVSGDGAVASHGAFEEQKFQPGARQDRNFVAEEFVEALAGMFRAGFDREGGVG